MMLILLNNHICYLINGCKNTFYEDREIQDMKKYYQIKRNLMTQHNFTNFLEDYNRYRAENFNVHQYFHELSKNISHFDVA